jgi:hypothetical protein
MLVACCGGHTSKEAGEQQEGVAKKKETRFNF